MEAMPYQPHVADTTVAALPPRVTEPAPRADVTDVTTSDWRARLPVLCGDTVTLRELRRSDAPSLLALLTTEEVSRFISPPPTTLEGFERFIEWTHEKRREGRYACFAVVPEGMETAVGIFQVRALDADFGTAEWGFVLGSPYWGRGFFLEGAELVVPFAFDTIGVRRLEARACVENGRGTGALRKVGATREGVLRQSLLKDGRYYDQAIWSLLASDWAGRHERPMGCAHSHVRDGDTARDGRSHRHSSVH